MTADPVKLRTRRIWALTVMFCVAVIVLTADAISKQQVLARLAGHPPVRLLHGLLTLDLTFNAGAAFGVGTSYTAVIALIVCGVIGIEGRQGLVDGSTVTVPRYAFYFDEYGWGVENYGVDPDVEVLTTPEDWAAGHDPQLETAVRLALEALEKQPPKAPPDPATGPAKARPPLPPRGAA